MALAGGIGLAGLTAVYPLTRRWPLWKAGLLGGAGFGLVLRGSATTGGSDMLASLIHRHIPALRVSVGIFSVDALVIIASA